MSDKEKIIQLIAELNKYRDAYYNQNMSLISDKEYDEKFDELSELEQKTNIIYSNSPTQSVGYEVLSKLAKVKHNHPLLSLDKTTDIDTFVNYFKDKDACIMAKMDGLTASIVYKNGKLVSAESRGNGEIGEDITHNAKVFTNLPVEIPFKGELIIDGECIITQEDFEMINKPLIDKANEEAKKLNLEGNDLKEYIRKHSYANPRNLVSGTVRQFDSKIAAKRKVKFIAWKLYSIKNENELPNENIKTFGDSFKLLSSLGFEVVPYFYVDKNWIAKDIGGKVALWENYIKKIKSICINKKYPIDGITASFDNIKYGFNLGSTSHHPKHSLAFKFYQERNETQLLDIEWNTSRTGLVNPVAIVEPVEIDGTTVSRASLSNVSIIKELELGIGDTITIIKANQIIPQIKDNLTRSNTYDIPSVCPSCGQSLLIKNDTGREMLYCVNKKCPSINNDKIVNFASREAMNIAGVSVERLRILMDKGYISDFASLYSLSNYAKEISEISGFGESSVNNLLAAIEESKKCKLANALVSFGIHGIGKSTSKTISKHLVFLKNNSDFDSVNLLSLFVELTDNNYDWTELDDFGFVMSNAINEYVQSNKEEIEKMIPILRIIEDTQTMVAENIFGGKTFCITGKLLSYKNRDKLVEDIEKFGGKVVSSVSAKTNFLINNDSQSASSKNQKALKVGTKIITENEFIEMLNK